VCSYHDVLVRDRSHLIMGETMATATETIQELADKEYKYGFVTDIESTLCRAV